MPIYWKLITFILVFLPKLAICHFAARHGWCRKRGRAIINGQQFFHFRGFAFINLCVKIVRSGRREGPTSLSGRHLVGHVLKNRSETMFAGQSAKHLQKKTHVSFIVPFCRCCWRAPCCSWTPPASWTACWGLCPWASSCPWTRCCPVAPRCSFRGFS